MKKIVFFFLSSFFLLVNSSFAVQKAYAAPQPVQLYQATPRTYSWTVNGRTYRNNHNPFGIENYVCMDENGNAGSASLGVLDDCIPGARTKNGNKWWTDTCVSGQPGHDGLLQSSDTRRMNGTGQPNSQIQVCTDVVGQRSPYNFINTSTQFTYYSGMCSNGSVVALAPRPDIYDPVCSGITYENLIDNPSDFSQDQRNCLMNVDDAANVTACKGGVCRTYMYSHIPGVIWDDQRIKMTTYRNVCSLFTQGDGVYTIRFEAYDAGRGVYGSSSFYLTWLSNAISGNVFIDENKNGIKDAGESNYSGPISVAIDGKTTTIPSGGRYLFAKLTPDTTHTITYTALPTDYQLVYPLNGPPPSYSVTVGSDCNTNGARGAICTGDITNLNFAISNLYPWFQTTCGNMRIDSGITDRLYAGNAALVTNSSCTNPGVAFSGDSPYSFGRGQISNTDWIVGGTTYPETYQAISPIFSSYASLSQKVTQGEITPTDLASVCALSNCTLPGNLPHGIYRANSNVVLNAYTFPANQSYIVLINGNLTINGTILVPQGSSAVFAVTGDIIVDDGVGTTASSTAPSIEGIYTTNRSFIVNSAGTCVDRRLNIGGSVVVNATMTGGRFQNNRDLCDGDRLYPTISFVQRLDFLFSLPTFLRSANTYSWEAAP